MTLLTCLNVCFVLYDIIGCGGGGFPCPEYVCGARQGVDGI